MGNKFCLILWKPALPKILEMVELVLQSGWWRLYLALFEMCVSRWGSPMWGAAPVLENHLLHRQTTPGIEADST